MKRHWRGGLAVAIAALSVTAPASSGQAPASAPATAIVGELKRSGGGFACTFTIKDGINLGDVIALGVDAPCMRVGPVALGLPRVETEAILGRPLSTAEERQGTMFVYPLAWSGAPKTSDLLTYAAVAYDAQDRVKILQLSGEKMPPPRDWAFSAVRLGHPDTAVLAALGEPFSRSPVPDNGAELWAYGPWTFTFEVKDGKVISIRLGP